MKMNPYLSFPGNCEEAFKYYEKHLGGKIEVLMTVAGTPMEAQSPPDWLPKIIHGRMVVGEAVLMGGDVPDAQYTVPSGFSLMINATSAEEAERLFAALADSGTVQMPLSETFWAIRFGAVVDRFGIPWMIGCDRPAQ